MTESMIWIILMFAGGGLVMVLFQALTGRRDYSQNPGGEWAPPELPEDEWQKWSKN